MREALQRAESDGADSEGVVEKVRGVVEELSGMEDDTETTENEEVTALNSRAREIRKEIYASQAEIGGADVEKLREIKGKIDELVDEVYRVRQKEECPTCRIKSATEKEPEEKPSLEQYGKGVAEARRRFIEEIRGQTEKA